LLIQSWFEYTEKVLYKLVFKEENVWLAARFFMCGNGSWMPFLFAPFGSLRAQAWHVFFTRL
jgi:hypothetical protein